MSFHHLDEGVPACPRSNQSSQQSSPRPCRDLGNGGVKNMENFQQFLRTGPGPLESSGNPVGQLGQNRFGQRLFVSDSTEHQSRTIAGANMAVARKGRHPTLLVNRKIMKNRLKAVAPGVLNFVATSFFPDGWPLTFNHQGCFNHHPARRRAARPHTIAHGP